MNENTYIHKYKSHHTTSEVISRGKAACKVNFVSFFFNLLDFYFYNITDNIASTLITSCDKNSLLFTENIFLCK